MNLADLLTSHAISPAGGKDQDRYLIEPGFLGTADGATPLGPTWRTDVGDFAAFALAQLASASRAQTTDIHAIWRHAIVKSASRFSVVEPELSCGVAMVRQVEDSVELATLGDCGAIVSRRHDPTITLRDTRIPTLDAEVAAATGDEAERRRLRNRASMNTPGGYWIFAGNPVAASHVLTTRVRLDDVAELLLFTDGFYRLREPYAVVRDDDQLLQLVREAGPKGAMEELRRYEESSEYRSSAERPRADDATVVFATHPRSR